MKKFRMWLVLCLMILISGSDFAQQPAWRVASGTGSGVVAVDFYRKNPDSMFALGSRFFLGSTNKGESWDSIGLPSADYGGIGIDPTNSQVIYISIPGFIVQSNDIFQSTDGGRTWRGPLYIGSSAVVTVIEFDPIDPSTVYIGVGPGRLYRSSDTGQTWDTLRIGGFLMSSLSIAPSDNNILYAGFVGGAFKSTDRGNSWVNLSFGFQPPGGILVSVDPRDANVVYAALWNNGTGPGGMYKTTDGGSVWTEINNGIESQDRQVKVLAVNPQNPDQLLLGIASDQHVMLRTTNGGNSWSEFVDGMAGAGVVKSIEFDTLNNRVYAGAYSSQGGAGLYIRETVTNVDPGRSATLQVDLSQNYPNPFNPSTQIRFQLPGGNTVSLIVYDVLGRKVAELVNSYVEQGYHTVTWDATTIAGGVYFAGFTVSNQVGGVEFTKVNKLLLMK